MFTLNEKSNVWFLAAFLVTAAYVGAYLLKVFSCDFIIQDDARAHVFWAYKYFFPGYFHDNPMADYFEAMAPHGYRGLYKYAAILGVPPFLLNKLLPVALGFITCYYMFRLAQHLFDHPAVAFVATLLLNHMLWGHNNLPSATPRAFIYPLLVASLFYMAHRSFWPLLLTLLLESLLYPHALLISVATYGLLLIRFDGTRLRLTGTRREYLQTMAIAGFAVLALLPYLLKSHDFGSLVTVSEAVKLPEFQKGGRSAFFFDNNWKYWLWSKRSGLWPSSMGLLVNTCLILSLAFPYLWKRKDEFGLSNPISLRLGILYRLVFASVLMFLLAHLMLFHLHLPSRFTQHSFRIVVALLGAQVLVASGQFVWQSLRKQTINSQLKRIGAYLLLTSYGILLTYPLALRAIGKNLIDGANFEIGKQPELYRFFSTQPTDSVIAVLSDAANDLPAFSLRSVVYAPEYAIGYHRGYFAQMENRRSEMEAAYLTDNPQLLQRFIEHYHVSHFVVDDAVRDRWASAPDRSAVPVVSKAISECRVYSADGVEVLDAKCVNNGNQSEERSL